MIRSLQRHDMRMIMSWDILREPETEAERLGRGYERQERRRETERHIRKGTLTFNRWMKTQGRSPQESADRIGIHMQNIYRWEEKWNEDRLEAKERGRPVAELPKQTEDEILDILDLLGPGIGVEVLQGLFPDISRRELRYRLHRFRNMYREAEAFLVQILSWKKAGRVWAMDHLDAPVPIDGKFKYVLAVRDLGSSKTLLSLPVENKKGKTTADALKHLFKAIGTPLVIKCDNHGSFNNGEVNRLLRKKKIKKLLSPPWYPCYNGAIEAGIGQLKTRTHYEASRHGRPGEWTCDDVEAARLHGNHTARPKGAKGPTPEQMWKNRSPISKKERELFLKAVDKEERRLVKEHEADAGTFTAREVARMERVAISTALRKEGYFSTRRRRIIPPIFRQIFLKIP